jgi:hypothetical protein
MFEVVDWIWLAEDVSIGRCEHGSEPWDSLKGGVYLHQLIDSQFSRRTLLHDSLNS